jgi:hypothetical protein
MTTATTARRPLCRYCRKRRPYCGDVCGDCRDTMACLPSARRRNYAKRRAVKGCDAPATPPWVLERIEVYRARAAAMLPLFEGLAPGVG